MTYRGKLNQYVVQIKERRIVLLPLDPKPEKESEKPSILSQEKSEFMGEVKRKGGGLALVMTEIQNKPTHEIPKAVQELLNSFPEVTTESVHPVFPPRWEIDHQIDLIPGSRLPN